LKVLSTERKKRVSPMEGGEKIKQRWHALLGRKKSPVPRKTPKITLIKRKREQSSSGERRFVRFLNIRGGWFTLRKISAQETHMGGWGGKGSLYKRKKKTIK